MSVRTRLRAASGGDGAAVPTDDELLVRAATGDRDAFASFYDRLGGLVYGNVRRILQDPTRPSIVTKRVFAEVWQHAVRFDPAQGDAQTWVLSLAHRRAVEQLRADDPRRRDGSHDEAVPVSDPSTPRDDGRPGALSALEARERETIELAYYRGYTYREVAEELDAPLSKVETYMRDGLLRLGEVFRHQDTSDL